jgi:geranylgeranyl pyrophosphate synthase
MTLGRTAASKLALGAGAASLVAELGRALGPDGTSALDGEVPAAVWRRALAGPAAEFLARPGKQLRAAFVEAGWSLAVSAPAAMPERLPLVVELLHAGSLVIDDIQDDAHERRGGPALHRMIGVPLAINTGCWMYFWALAELSELGLSEATELAIHRAATSTLVRCHQGQALDLAITIAELSAADVPAVVEAATRLKTGALCAFATTLGALAAGGPPGLVAALARFGEEVGAALQMLDDLGSITAPARRAKGHEDLGGGRPTWPWAWLAETRPFAWGRLAARVRGASQPDELDAIAAELAGEIVATGRVRIRALLDRAIADVTAAVGHGPAIEALAAALSRMEESYG